MAAATGDDAWGGAFRARRGQLLQVAPPWGMPPLKHGLMEADYSKVRPADLKYRERCDSRLLHSAIILSRSLRAEYSVATSREL